MHDLLEKRKHKALAIKISLEPSDHTDGIKGLEDLEDEKSEMDESDENRKLGLAPALDDEKEEDVEMGKDTYDMPDSLIDDMDKRRLEQMLEKKKMGNLGRVSLGDKAKMEMLKKKG